MKDFKNVENKYRPVPFWSWNDRLSTDETTFQIDQMEEQGIGGSFMHARGGLTTEYMGEEWFDNVRCCIEKCKKNGMKPWAYDENGWPSGFGAGYVNGKGIAYQQKYLRCEKGEKNTDTTIINIGGIHFYYEVNPFYVDVLDAKVVREFIEYAYQPYYEKFSNDFEGFFTDEPAISRNGIPWSFVLPEEYEKAYGENLVEVLPQLFSNIGNYKTTRVRFWKLVTELFSKNYMKQIYDWCTERNLKFTGHLVLEENLYIQLTTNGACMPHYEYMTIPGMDWLGRNNDDSLTPYQVGSAARQLGKKQVLSETFALCGHNIGHDELKWIFEHQMVRGINQLCQHLQGYSNRGIRKRDYPPAMYIQQPWWKDYRMFNDAMSRIGKLLTEGDDGVEVLVIHPQTTAWSLYNGSSAYREWEIPQDNDIMKLNREFMDVLLTLEKKHINFHLGDEILMERHGHVDGNKLVIGEKHYTKVILPRCDVLLEYTEKLLEKFKSNGGKIVNVDDIECNDIINVPEITYCERRCKDYNLYYFVNSTENTYQAYISKGNKIMRPETGEVCNFDGYHRFHKYESLVVIDDFGERVETEQKQGMPVNLDGMWDVSHNSENILTLDYCDYYFDGELEEKNGYILNAMYRALDKRRPVNISCDFKFIADYIPDNIYLVCEQPENFDITVNGNEAEKTPCGYFVDKSFVKLDISKHIHIGENIVTMTVDFRQREEVYENIEKSMQHESEKNKLTFDMELEQIYIVGNFSVKTDGRFIELDRNACRYDGEFVISEPCKSISLCHIERQGFPFFAGEITVKKTFETADENMFLDFQKCGINVVKAKINNHVLPLKMWEPYWADISSCITKGINQIELTLVNNLRNMQGPFHLAEGESYLVGPPSFHKEKCVWCDILTNWDERYCFACISLQNK